MGRVVFVVVSASLVLLPFLAKPGRASLYSPEEPFAVPVGNDGKAAALPFDEFKRRLAVLTNALNDKVESEDRKRFLARIREQEKVLKPTATESAALAADLLRVGQSDRAIALLGPRTADRRPDYFVFSTLGTIHAARGEWADALRYHQEGQLDTKMPATLKGLSQPQRDWWEKLDAEYVPHLYQLRRNESEARRGLSPVEREKADETEDVLPLFPVPTGGTRMPPARFVNDAGEYEAGVIAAAEKAKLPSDALAVVQQLLFWYPGETRLYWLLAELYAANGDVASGVAILDECTWGRQYGNRKVLITHRQALRIAADARPKASAPDEQPLVRDAGEKPPADPIEPPGISLSTIGIYFGIVAAVAVLALLRTILKRKPHAAS